MTHYFEKLSQTNIFKGINALEVENLFRNKLFRIKNYQKDEYIAFTNDICNNLMFIIEGAVRGEMTDYSGKVIKIEDLVAPKPIAPAFVFGEQNNYPVDIIANNTCTIFVVPKETLIFLLQEDSDLLRNFLDVLSNRAQFLSNKIRFLNFKTIKSKIASYLLKLSYEKNEKITIPMSQTQLADFFGVTRPSLARALGEMEDEGILKITRREVLLKNRNRLSELVR